MQVVVRRSDLSNPNPYVIASYDDTVIVDVTALGLDDQSATVLTVPASAVTYPERGPPMLASNWRDSAAIVANAEAFLRIEQVFQVTRSATTTPTCRTASRSTAPIPRRGRRMRATARP